MVVPDYNAISETFLFGEGFQDAGPLSRKLVDCFRHATEQLSPQRHYDWGLRAIKTVLTVAGNLRRKVVGDAGSKEGSKDTGRGESKEVIFGLLTKEESKEGLLVAQGKEGGIGREGKKDKTAKNAVVAGGGEAHLFVRALRESSIPKLVSAGIFLLFLPFFYLSFCNSLLSLFALFVTVHYISLFLSPSLCNCFPTSLKCSITYFS